MKKSQLNKNTRFVLSGAKRDVLYNAVEKLEMRISGKKGAEEARDRFFTGLVKLYPWASSSYQPAPRFYVATQEARRKIRFAAWKRQSAESLAANANLRSDEHGSYSRGDHLSVYGLDLVGHWESAAAPYWDMGGEGLGLVECTRTRTYAKSSKWGPSRVSTRFLVGKNEAGTYFSHPVGPNCATVEEAVQWIWSGKADKIIQRQGDIALISGNSGPRMPAHLPTGHKIQGDIITHATHPDLPMPKNPGERIIIGRRAAERASEATRD